MPSRGGESPVEMETIMSIVKIYNCLFDLSAISSRAPEWMFAAHPCCPEYKEVYVDIPFPISYDESGRAWLNIDGQDVLLCDVLANDGDDPALVWSNDSGKHVIQLEIIDHPKED